jgi:hypothetical protein
MLSCTFKLAECSDNKDFLINKNYESHM